MRTSERFMYKLDRHIEELLKLTPEERRGIIARVVRIASEARTEGETEALAEVANDQLHIIAIEKF